MKTKTINLYTIKELSKEAQEKAHRNYTKDNDYPFLGEAMKEHLIDLLAENGIQELDKEKTRVFYSLGYSQGDGAMFEGVFEYGSALEKVGGQWKRYQVIVKQSGHYYHYNSKTLEITSGDDIANEADEAVYKEFDEDFYKPICKKLEKYGYDWIEEEDSIEHFVDECEQNGWTFREDGTMENE